MEINLHRPPVVESPNLKLHKRVTVSSDTTILIVPDPGTVVITQNPPYYTDGCFKNVKMVGYADIVVSVFETILCAVAVSFSFVILESTRDSGVIYMGETRLTDQDWMVPRGLLHGVIVLGFLLISWYLFNEIRFACRLLNSLTLNLDRNRREIVHGARCWRCANFIVIIFEIFFGGCSSVCGSHTLAGCGVLVGVVLRVVGICIVQQFIQELETVAVAPVVMYVGNEGIGGGGGQVPVSLNNPLQSSDYTGGVRNSRQVPVESTMHVPLNPVEFLDQLKM